MRVIVFVKATKNSEAGVMPSRELIAEMGKFNEQLIKAGVMLAGEGLHASSKGARVKFSGAKRTVVNGPFSETSELVAGFWIWKVESLEQAIDWAKRCPNPTGDEGVLEIRPIMEMEDLGDMLTPELKQQEASQRARSEQLAKTGTH